MAIPTGLKALGARLFVTWWARLSEGSAMKSLHFLLLATTALAVAILGQGQHLQHPDSGPDEGFGRVHMDISCRPAVAAEFDRALALLHNFWYVRALERFNHVLKNDPGCAMAYWSA